VHPTGSVVVEQGRGQLGTPGVVHAEEQHLGDVFGQGAVGLGEGP